MKVKKNPTDLVVTGKNSTDSSRRQFIKKTAAATVLAAAGPVILPKFARAAARPIKIGFVTPKTGVLSAFGDCDDFVLRGVRKAVPGGIMVNGTNHPVEIIVKDTLSETSRSAQVAAELIKSDKVDLLLSACHVDTIKPAAEQAEVNGVPCITTDCPWQLIEFGRGDPQKGFDWTYHFFWGFEDDIAVDLDLWTSIPTNKVLGALWPNDQSGIGYSDPKMGFPTPLQEKGFKVVDPGRFDYNTPDFSAQIAMFKKAQVEIVHGILSPSVFANFWNQAAQQGFKPKILTMSAALLFPAAVNSLDDDRGVGLTAQINWSPGFPFKSGLTGQTAAQLCEQWEKETGKQWTQPIGHKHALFEAAVDVLKRTKNIDSPKSIADAIGTTSYDSIVGHLQWPGQPFKNVCKTPLLGGQWVKGKKYKYDILIVNNMEAKEIPLQSPLKPL